MRNDKEAFRSAPSAARSMTPPCKRRLALCIGAAIAVGFVPARAMAAGAPQNAQRATPNGPDTPGDRAAATATPFGSTIPVTNCDDSGSGSLRAAVAAAGVGDTVDASGLTCSVITLTTSGIVTPENNASVTIVGPGRDALTIHADRNPAYLTHHVFTNYGTGVLTLRGMTITGGLVDLPAAYAEFRPLGGCVFAPVGSIALGDATLGASSGVVIDDCMVQGSVASQHSPAGGAVYAAESLSVAYSTISGSTASGGAGYQAAAGGGLYAKGRLAIVHSTISGNTASGDPKARGGGIFVDGPDSSIVASTISANSASTGAGLYVSGELGLKTSLISDNVATGRGGGLRSVGTLTVSDSTISDNTAYAAGGLDGSGHVDISGSTIADNEAIQVGGIALEAQHATISNSTVSGNTAENLVGGMFLGSIYDQYQMVMSGTTITDNTVISGSAGGAGLLMAYVSLTMQSTLVSGNFTAGADDDLSANLPVSGANNLVGHPSNATTVPDDTLVGIDPLLGPLADNGGPTWTHALPVGSPAIDAGNNAANLDVDQRGEGFLRVYGPQADIGAFEYQPTVGDEIFANGFDGASP